MKKYLYLLLAGTILMLAVGCSSHETGDAPDEDEKVYTYEELISLPADELLDLFIENGLVINDRLSATFTEEELQELFKSEFELLCQGHIIREDVMYYDLAQRTKEIYQKISSQN